MSSKDIEAGRAHVIIRLRDQVSAGLKHVERSLSGFGRNFATLGAAIGAGSGAALAFPLLMAADMEQLGISLEVLLGSGQAAKSMLKGLTDFAKATPFGLKDVGENAKLLLAYGVNANQILPNLKTLGDVALGDKDKFDRLSLAFGQTQAKGRLMGQEVLQMTEAGFNPLQEISRTTGISVIELSKRMEAGEISAAMLTRAFQTATSGSGRFVNGMERMSNSAYGMMGKLMDAVSFGLKPIGDAAIAILKPVVGFATDVASAFQVFAEKNQGLVKAVAGVLIGLVAVGGVLTGIGLGAIALSTAFGGLAVISSILFTTVGSIASALLGSWGLVASAIGILFSPIATLGAVLGSIWGLITGAFFALATVFSPAGIAIGLLIFAAIKFRTEITSAFMSVMGVMREVSSAIGRVGAVFGETWGGIFALVMAGDLRTAAQIAWMGVVAATWTAVEEIANVISQIGAAMWAASQDVDSAVGIALNYLGRFLPGVDSVRSYIEQAFGSISRSILAGRWDLAGAIAMQKIRMAMQSGLDSISLAWAATMTGLGAMWDFVVFGIGRSWAYVVGGWNNGVLMMKKGLNAIVQSIDYLVTSLMILERQAQAATGDKFASKHIADYRREFAARTEARNKDLADEEAANKRAFNGRINAQDQQLNKSLTGRVQNEQAIMNAQQQRRMQQQQKLAQLEQQAREAYAKSGDPTLALRAQQAREALSTAIKGATDKPDDPAIKGITQQASAGVQMLGKVSSSGTFSAAGAAASLGFNGAPMIDTAKNTRRLVVLAERIRAREEARFS